MIQTKGITERLYMDRVVKRALEERNWIIIIIEMC